MQEPVSRITIIKLENLPDSHMPSASGPMKEYIAQYLEALASDNLSWDSNYLGLPSISALSGYFNTTSMDVYDALRSLQRKGFDYQFSSLDGLVQLWRLNPVVKSKGFRKKK